MKKAELKSGEVLGISRNLIVTINVPDDNREVKEEVYERALKEAMDKEGLAAGDIKKFGIQLYFAKIRQIGRKFPTTIAHEI